MTKEGQVSYCFFFCYSVGSRTCHPCTIRYYSYGQVTQRLLHPRCCQHARWARCQHGHRKLRALNWPNYDGASKLVLCLVKWGSILYKASLTFIFLAILCISQIHFIMQVHSFISWIPNQGSVEAWRSSLSFSLVSLNLGTRFLFSGVVCQTLNFPILGCAKKTLNKMNYFNIWIKFTKFSLS